MTLLSFPFKHAAVNWRRSVTIGVFLFVVGFFMVFLSSFTSAAKDVMQGAIIAALTGEIQVRSGLCEEGDMAGVAARWNEIPPLSPAETAAVETALRSIPDATSTKRVRADVLLISDTERLVAMTIGIEPRSAGYRGALEFLDGRALDPDGTHEIVLAPILAKKLGVKIGDTVGVLGETRDGIPADIGLTVVGIAKVRTLSLFGVAIAYMDLASAQEILGFAPGEASDLLIYLADRRKTRASASALEEALRGAGVPVLPARSAAGPGVRITTWKEMGSFFKGVVNGFIGMLYFFIAVLLLVAGTLIVSLILQMAVDRFKEIGTLRAIGFGRRRIVRLFVEEILLLTGFFGTAGIALGAAVVFVASRIGLKAPVPTWTYIMGDRLFLHLGPFEILVAIAVLFGLAVVASSVPARMAASMNPVETLKEN